ncbi:MAG TPA: DoxX family membrane protein [Streptosporangiaceae bacterium]|jgi:thiosulfate dehydrogenase (quinone) large subunit|nr:DoxX family membrane protein [Streptosporangiaceae bacterium]
MTTQTPDGAAAPERGLSRHRGPPPTATPAGNVRIADWLYRSKPASVLWLVARVWLGYGWLNAGYQKLWGSEKAAFWNGGGAGVKGFATAGVAGSKAGTGGASYGWFAGFLHGFVIPNASWIAKVVAVSELAIGILLILGLLTGAAAVAGLVLNVIYMFSGSSGVNPAYAIVAVFLILAWRNAGYIGLDRFAFPMMRGRPRPAPRMIQPVEPAPPALTPRADPQPAPSGT